MRALCVRVSTSAFREVKVGFEGKGFGCWGFRCKRSFVFRILSSVVVEGVYGSG